MGELNFLEPTFVVRSLGLFLIRIIGQLYFLELPLKRLLKCGNSVMSLSSRATSLQAFEEGILQICVGLYSGCYMWTTISSY